MAAQYGKMAMRDAALGRDDGKLCGMSSRRWIEKVKTLKPMAVCLRKATDLPMMGQRSKGSLPMQPHQGWEYRFFRILLDLLGMFTLLMTSMAGCCDDFSRRRSLDDVSQIKSPATMELWTGMQHRHWRHFSQLADWLFLDLIFTSVRILKFQCDPFNNLKDSSQVQFPYFGACKKWCILFLDIFQWNLTHL
jgi:hypothetical protein